MGGLLSKLRGGSFGSGFGFGALGTLVGMNPAAMLSTLPGGFGFGGFGVPNLNGFGLPNVNNFGLPNASGLLQSFQNPLGGFGQLRNRLGSGAGLNLLPNVGAQIKGRLGNLKNIAQNGLFGGLINKVSGGSFGQGFKIGALSGLIGGSPGALLNRVGQGLFAGAPLQGGIQALGARFQNALLAIQLAPNRVAQLLSLNNPVGSLLGQVTGKLSNMRSLMQNMLFGALASKLSGGSIKQGLQVGAFLASASGMQQTLASLTGRATSMGLSYANMGLGQANRLIGSGAQVPSIYSSLVNSQVQNSLQTARMATQLPLRFQNALYAKLLAKQRGIENARKLKQLKVYQGLAAGYRRLESDFRIESF
jgi:hypothetical protein